MKIPDVSQLDRVDCHIATKFKRNLPPESPRSPTRITSTAQGMSPAIYQLI